MVTVLNPNFNAYLGMGDLGDLSATLFTVAVNFTHGQGISTTYIQPQYASNTINFAMPTGLSAIIIFDAVGYFSASGATALSCVVATRANVAIGAGADGQALSPACSTGYTLVGGGCYAIDFRVYLDQYRPSAGKWECQYTNTNAFTSAIRADATCCRVPGR